MRSVGIVGAGQAGLILGIGLLRNGYKANLYSNRTAKQILNGKIMSTQIYWGSAIEIERKHQLNHWEKQFPKPDIVEAVVYDTQQSKFISQFIGKLSQPYHGIDQRLKFSTWLDDFESLGGHLHIKDVNVKLLEEISAQNDLTIVCAGQGELSNIFERDNNRSTMTQPARHLCAFYTQSEHRLTHNRLDVFQGIGETLMMLGMTKDGLCDMVTFEAIPGKEFDCFSTLNTPNEVLRKGVELLEKFAPWEAKRFENAKLTDENAVFVGKFTPTVRHPTCQLPNGKFVLGLGDSVVVNDPVAGQGGNSATKSADLYLKRIVEHGDKPFDQSWVEETFELSWQKYTKWSTQLTNAMLDQTPELVELIMAGPKSQTTANFIVDSFDHPERICSHLNSMDDIRRKIAQLV